MHAVEEGCSATLILRTALRSGTMRILVVEDEKRIADFLSRGLLEAGGTPSRRCQAPGSSAIDMVHTADYDLVILDLGLPDMDGLAVLQKICNRPGGR